MNEWPRVSARNFLNTYTHIKYDQFAIIFVLFYLFISSQQFLIFIFNYYYIRISGVSYLAALEIPKVLSFCSLGPSSYGATQCTCSEWVN